MKNTIQFRISEHILNRIYKLGRNKDKSDIAVVDGTVSRIHAELEIKDNEIKFKDLNSGMIVITASKWDIYRRKANL